MKRLARKSAASTTGFFANRVACSRRTNTALIVKKLNKRHPRQIFGESGGHHQIYLFAQQGARRSKAPRRGEIYDIAHRGPKLFAELVVSSSQGIEPVRKTGVTFKWRYEHPACAARPQPQ